MLAIHLHPVNIATFCAFLLRGPERQSRAWNLVSSLRRSPGGLKFSSLDSCEHGSFSMEKRQGNFAAMKGIIKMLELGISKTTGKGSCVSMNGCNLLNITHSDSEDFQLKGVYHLWGFCCTRKAKAGSELLRHAICGSKTMCLGGCQRCG